MSDLILKLKVVCTQLPGLRFDDTQDPQQRHKEPVHLGMQRDQEVIQRVPADRRQVTFKPEFEVGKKKDGSPNFLGPFSQGPAGDRFFYLSWGTLGGSSEFHMFRRLKVRLGHLTWPQIRRSMRGGQPLVVRLRLTDDRGGPLCATPPAANIDWEL